MTELLTNFILFEKPIEDMSKEEREAAVCQLRAIRLPSARPVGKSKKIKVKKASAALGDDLLTLLEEK